MQDDVKIFRRYFSERGAEERWAAKFIEDEFEILDLMIVVFTAGLAIEYDNRVPLLERSTYFRCVQILGSRRLVDLFISR